MSSYITISIILVLIIIIFIMNHISKIKNEIVEENSIYLKKIKELNIKYCFKTYTDKENKNVYFDYKRNYDNFNAYNYFQKIVYSNFDYYRNIVLIATENKNKKDMYIKEFESVEHTPQEIIEQFKISYKSFIRRETKIGQQHKKNPLYSYSITIVYSYTSPKGRNSYESKAVFNIDNLAAIVNSYKPIPAKIEKGPKIKTSKSDTATPLSVFINKPKKKITSIDDLEEIKD